MSLNGHLNITRERNIANDLTNLTMLQLLYNNC